MDLQDFLILHLLHPLYIFQYLPDHFYLVLQLVFCPKIIYIIIIYIYIMTVFVVSKGINYNVNNY